MSEQTITDAVRNLQETHRVKGNGFVLTRHDTTIFLGWLETLRSPHTIAQYRRMVLSVCERYEASLSDIAYDQWVSYMNEEIPRMIVIREISVSTSRLMYYSICGFLTYAREHDPEFLPVDPIPDFLLPALSVPTKTSELPSAEQLAILMQEAEITDPQLQMILVLVYECALSSQEILSLMVSDIRENDAKELYLIIRASGSRKERKIEVRTDVADELKRYLYQHQLSKNELVFLNQRGKPLSIRRLQQRMQKLQEPMVQSGELHRYYSLSNIRTAAIHRMLVADHADEFETAQYVGVRADYVGQIKAAGIPELCKLPGKKHDLTLEQLLKNGE